MVAVVLAELALVKVMLPDDEVHWLKPNPALGVAEMLTVVAF